MADERESKAALPAITPETRIADLLQDYPSLEAVLIGLSPQFALLKNPVLRRTVAKVATLGQVAKTGGLSIAELIATLRAAVGQLDTAAANDERQQPAEDADWQPAEDAVVVEIDARPMIAAGEQPLNRVLSGLSALSPGAVLKLITPFEPAPLIDLARKQGCRVRCRAAGESLFHTFFAKSL